MRQRAMRSWKAVLVLSLVLMPGAASAGLTGDPVTATLTEGNTSTTIFTGTVPVLDPGGPEFTGIFDADPELLFTNISRFNLDLLDNGFQLSFDCVDPSCDLPDPVTFTLALSSLDFTPPANLTGLVSPSGLLTVSGSPVVTPSSITITFQSFTLASGGELPAVLYEASFVTEQVTPPGPTVPLPATLLLLSAGLGLGALALRRPRA
jgi:hypothetical protein